MTVTEGPAGARLTYPLFGNPTLPADAPILSPHEFGAPTAVFGVQGAAVWRFEAPDAGRYRVDAALTQRLVKTPLPFNHVYSAYYYVFEEGVFGPLLANTTDNDTEDSTGALFDYDPGSTFWIVVWPQEYDADTLDSYSTASWAVPRIGGPGVEETVQLPDRDCIVAFSDNTYVTREDANVVIGTPLTPDEEFRAEMTDFLNGYFEGGMGFQEPFGLESGIVGTYGGAWAIEWLVSRRQSAGTYWYDDAFGSTFTGEPTGPPSELSPGPAEGSQWPDGITLCGFDMHWNGAALLPTTAFTRTFACGFSMRHETITGWPGKLGDGVPDTAYDTSEERLAVLSQYLTTEGVPDSIDFDLSDVGATLLEMYFQADEAPSSWWDRNGNTPAAIKDVNVAWMTSLPPHEVLDWGVYLDDAGNAQMSNIANPENWNDPTLEVLIVDGVGGGWVPIDWEARQAYQDDLDVEFDSEVVPGYRFFAFPTQLWDPNVPDATLGSPAGGNRGHYNNDPRFALKLRVRPVPFTAFFPPLLEPADPVYPELVTDPGPNRAAFWPQ